MRRELAVGSAALVALFSGACGDNSAQGNTGAGPTPWDRSDREPVPAEAKTFEIDVRVGGCVAGEGKVEFGREVDHLDVDESAEAVTVTAWTRPIDDAEGEGTDVCLDVGASIPATVTLEEPLGKRQLREGFCDVDEVKDRLASGDPEGRCSEDLRVIQP